MLKKDPEGYKKLLVYKKADELHVRVLKLADLIKGIEREVRGQNGVNKIILELADQMGRAARSPKSNVVEGWKRNSTKEYFDYLGFSIGSVEEIKEDCKDIISGKYQDLKGVTGLMGKMGGRGHEAEKGKMGGGGGNPITSHYSPSSFQEVEKLPFYPLPPLTPLPIEVYLRCKELSFLLYKLQQSLDTKMNLEGTKSTRAKLLSREQQRNEEDKWLAGEMKRLNLKN
jgi:four helix bundle protein